MGVVISIITPIYKGKKYLPALARNIRENLELLDGDTSVEWIISNDYPDEPIGNICLSDTNEIGINADNLKIIVLETDCNRGIQGARVQGLVVATGEFVLFLDQDDRIASDWISSQLSHIENGDAVVSECIFDNRPFYNNDDRPVLDICIRKEYLISEKNGFVPGQVLIRRNAIPETWKRRIMKTNCCDDQFLWICMFSQGEVFKPNPNTKYYHFVSGTNQSRDLIERYRSNQELVEIVKKEKLLSDEEITTLSQSRDREVMWFLGQNAIQKRKIRILKELLTCHEDGIDRFDNFYDGEIAIYGADIGVHLAKLLLNNRKKVACIVDRAAGYIKAEVPVVTRESIPLKVKFIVNTILADEKEVHGFLRENYPLCRVIDVEELLKIRES